MSDASRILDELDAQDSPTASRLLPEVYDGLHRLAAARLAREAPGLTLQATALVHEAYVRLAEGQPQQWDGKGHFFAAVAEVMRRILVEEARRKKRLKRGGDMVRQDVDPAQFQAPEPDDELLTLDAALVKLAAKQPDLADLVKLRYFANLTIPEAASVLGVSPRTADSRWATARAWLRIELHKSHE